MQIPSFVIKAAQHAADIDVDGKVGPKTLAALREYDDECDDFDCAEDRDRLIVSVAQHAAGLRDSDIDGKMGPVTQAAIQKYVAAHIGATQSGSASRRRRTAMAVWEPHEGPGVYEQDSINLRDHAQMTPPRGLEKIPNRKTLKSVYGDAAALGKEGMRARLLSLKGLPGRFNRGDGKLSGVHELMAPHLRLGLELCQLFGVIDEIYRIGTFNYRHMRHDPKMPLSFHAYGICMDLNPRENFGWVPKGPERKIVPFSEAWYEKYPRGLSEVAVLCFKKAGFAWGGDWPSFRDPMHFELVRPR